MDAAAVKMIIEEGIAFVKKTGIQVTEVEPHRALLTLPHDESNLNPMGILHAGATFTLAETAGAAVCLIALPQDRVRFLGKEIRIRFRRPGRGDATCEARLEPSQVEAVLAEVEGGGKPDLTLPMEIHDAEGQVICEVEATYAVRGL